MSLSLPHNLDAEKYLLGGIIIDNSLLIQTLDVVNPDDFYSEQHRVIYIAMEHLYDNSIDINHVTIVDALKTLKLYSNGSSITHALQGLISSIPRTSDLTPYIETLKQHSRNRHKIKLNAELNIALHNNDKDEVEAIETKLLELGEDTVQVGLQTLEDSLGHTPLQEAYTHGITGKKLTGLSTGFKVFDDITLGVNKQEMVVLAARPAVGKTSAALTIALHLIKQNKVVAMFSLEMSKKSLYLRLLSALARVDQKRLKTGTLTKVEWARAIYAHKFLAPSLLLIDDTGYLTPRMLETQLKKAIRKYGSVDLVVVDYLQLMNSNTKKENRQQEVTEISRQLRELSKRNNVAMLALSQLSRASESRAANMHRPQLSDLRESGAIEQEADIVAFLYREELYNPDAPKGATELIMAKSRHSDIDTINLYFVKSQTRFENVFIS